MANDSNVPVGIWNDGGADAAMMVVQLHARSTARSAAVGMLTVEPIGPMPDTHPLRQSTLLLQATVLPREGIDRGRLIEAVALPWFDIVAELQRDPGLAFQISPEKWEEIVAGAYKRAGFDEVILTPRSGDLGRDIIAAKRALGTIRIIDQVKAFKPRHLVTANDVRALVGVLHGDGASKGFLTTTSDFAPMLRSDPLMLPFIPSRLELINGEALLANLHRIAKSKPGI